MTTVKAYAVCYNDKILSLHMTEYGADGALSQMIEMTRNENGLAVNAIKFSIKHLTWSPAPTAVPVAELECAADSVLATICDRNRVFARDVEDVAAELITAVNRSRAARGMAEKKDYGIPYQEDGQRFFAIGIYRLCERLWMSENGSGEPLQADEKQKMLKYLRNRLRDWDGGHAPSDRIGRAMNELVNATLEYVRRKGQEK